MPSAIAAPLTSLKERILETRIVFLPDLSTLVIPEIIVRSPDDALMTARRRRREKSIKLAARRGVRETAKAALLGNQPGGTHEAAPGAARQCGANTDAPHTHRSSVRHRQLARIAEQKIKRLGGDGAHQRLDILPVLDAGRVQTICSGLPIGRKARDRLFEVGATDQE